jgi:UDP-N-acetylglucosamine--N-acetylmuramyl-(pentapeptide) pyrophosphoryl-undecaprenol N-acetylglucosamine transferase
MKILITGAHFTPAQAVIEEIQKIGKSEDRMKSEKSDDSAFQIIYVGRGTTMEGDKTPSVESQVLPKLGVHFIPITTGRLRRYLSLGTFLSLLKIPVGFAQAFWIILTQQPELVVSFGGYVAVPLVFWAWVFNIPVLIHEQTMVSGLANQISSVFATKIALTFKTNYSEKNN